MQHWVYAGIHLHLHLPAIDAYTYCYRTANAYRQASRDTEAAPDSAASTVREYAMLRRWNS